jgi:hypothetical protein
MRDGVTEFTVCEQQIVITLDPEYMAEYDDIQQYYGSSATVSQVAHLQDLLTDNTHSPLCNGWDMTIIEYGVASGSVRVYLSQDIIIDDSGDLLLPDKGTFYVLTLSVYELDKFWRGGAIFFTETDYIRFCEDVLTQRRAYIILLKSQASPKALSWLNMVELWGGQTEYTQILWESRFQGHLHPFWHTDDKNCEDYLSACENESRRIQRMEDGLFELRIQSNHMLYLERKNKGKNK